MWTTSSEILAMSIHPIQRFASQNTNEMAMMMTSKMKTTMMMTTTILTRLKVIVKIATISKMLTRELSCIWAQVSGSLDLFFFFDSNLSILLWNWLFFFNSIETQSESQSCATDNDDLGVKSISWWRYLLPFHYFVWIEFKENLYI